MSEQERHETDESTDEPDVEGHLMDTLGRDDVATEREAHDTAGEREAHDTAGERHRLDEHL